MNKRFFAALVVILVLVSAGAEASSLSASCTNGTFIGTSSGDVLMWKGIPYAKPPVGSLRWKAPQAPDSSNEVFDADRFEAIPIQNVASSDPEYYLPQDEDCLYLNIWTASTDNTALKPVMVWIHGGAFQSGGTASPYYDGYNFAKAHNDVIYVTVDYRLGMMGFIDLVHSGLPGAEEFPDSGNLGLRDVLQSLKWLNDNIASFGGDPDNITLFGQSSGSAMISLLMSVRESSGLFRRAITQSGTISMTSSRADCAPLTQKLIELTGANSMSDLMALSSSDLLTLSGKLGAYMNFPERDDTLLDENPVSSFTRYSGEYDLLTGTVKDELNYWITVMGSIEAFSQFLPLAYSQVVEGISQVISSDAAKAEEFIQLRSDLGSVGAIAEFFNDLLFRGPAITQANIHYSSNLGMRTLGGDKKNTYMYYWKYPSTVAGLGACHAVDIPYALNVDGYPLSNPLNRDLADKVQSMWVNFAKTGNPSDTWPEYNILTRPTLIIDSTITTENAPLDDQYGLIQPLLKYGISGRELINATASAQGDTSDTGTGTNTPALSDDVPGNVSGDVSGNLSGDVSSDDIHYPGSSGGGCNNGALYLPAVIYFALTRKRRHTFDGR